MHGHRRTIPPRYVRGGSGHSGGRRPSEYSSQPPRESGIGVNGWGWLLVVSALVYSLVTAPLPTLGVVGLVCVFCVLRATPRAPRNRMKTPADRVGPSPKNAPMAVRPVPDAATREQLVRDHARIAAEQRNILRDIDRLDRKRQIEDALGHRIADPAQVRQELRQDGELRWRIFHRDGYQCTDCGARGAEAELTIDHIVPVSRGGTNAEHNLTTLCRSCNSRKGARPPVHRPPIHHPRPSEHSPAAAPPAAEVPVPLHIQSADPRRVEVEANTEALQRYYARIRRADARAQERAT